MSDVTSLQTDNTREYRGICLTNLKPDDPGIIKVTVPTLMPGNLDGPLTPGTIKNQLEYTARDGTAKTDTATTSNHITAEWHAIDRQTYPPLVRMGEQVMVYQMGTSDKWFWHSLGRDSHLRELDRMRFEVSATPYTQQSKTDKNTYSFTIDPAKTKRVTLQTSKANGETYAYCIDINAEKGQICITDDKGDGTDSSPHNAIVMDSGQNLIQLTNNKRSTLSLCGEDGILYFPRDFRLRADRQIILDSPTTTFNGQNSGEKSVINIHSNGFTHYCDNYSLISTTIGIQGNVKHEGTFVADQHTATHYATRDPGGAYATSTTNTQKGTHDLVNVSPDTDTSGGGDRPLTAFPDFLKTAQACAEAIEKLGGDGSAILSAAQPAVVPKVKGE